MSPDEFLVRNSLGDNTSFLNVPAVGIRLESTRGIKLSPTTDTFPSKGNATGATGIITEFGLRNPLNSTVGSSLKSDSTRRDESPTSTTGVGTSITSRRLVTLLGDESATMDILRRTSRMEHEGDKDLWPRRGIFVDNEIQVADRSKMNSPNPKMINQKNPDS